MSRRLLLSRAWGQNVLAPSDEEPPAFEQPKLHIDFSTIASAIPYGAADQDTAQENAWKSMVGDYFARSYGLEHQTFDGEVMVSRHIPTPSGPNGSEVQGVRLGENALRLNLGRHGWCSYDFKLNADWNYDPDSQGKLPGLGFGDDFPSAGSNSPLADAWKGGSARVQFDSDDKSGVMYLESYAYYYQPDRRVSWTSTTGTMAGVQGYLTYDAQLNGTKFPIEKDRVYRITEHLIMNTGEDNHDGGLEIYVDGVLRFQQLGFRWVGPNHNASVKATAFDPTKGVDGFYFSHFYGGNHLNAPPHETHSTWYRILIGSTKEQVALGPPGPVGPTNEPPEDEEPPPETTPPDVLHGDINLMATTGFGGVTSSRLASAFGSSLRQSNGLQHLEVRQDTSGEKYLRMKYDPTSDGSTSAGFEIDLGAHEELYLSFQVFFENGWEWVKGGKLPGLGGGNTPSGGGEPGPSDGWLWRYMWRDNSGANPPGFARIPRLEGYLYHSDQASFYGDEIVLGPNGYTDPPIGQWITITMRVKMNTGTNFNGEIQTWINSVDHGNYVTRLREGDQNFSADVFTFSTFHGGNNSTWSPSQRRYARFRRFKVATTATGVDGVTSGGPGGVDAAPDNPPTTDGNEPGNMLRPSVVPSGATRVFEHDFSSGTVSPLFEEEAGGPDRITVSNGLLKIVLKPGDWKSGINTRSEAKTYQNSSNGGPVDYTQGRHFTVYDMLLPSGYISNTNTGDDTIIMQMHGPNAGTSTYQGPIVSFRTENGNIYVIHQHYQDLNARWKPGVIYQEPVQEGVWNRWIIETLLLESGGAIRVWKNGDLLVTRTGYTYNEGHRSWLGFKCGLYHEPVATTTMYVDNLQIYKV